jgi:type I restriction enzyme S subunit
MIEALKPYAEYKESGVPWLGKIPKSWDIIRGKYLFRFKKELNSNAFHKNVLSLTMRGVVNNNPDNPVGMVPKDYASYQLFRRNDLVFKLIDLENFKTSRVGLVHEDGIMSPAYIRLSLINGGDIRYFYHQFFDLYLRGVFNQLGAGVRATLGQNDLLDLGVVLPGLEEQTQIVRYLDTQDRRINRLIRDKRRLIDLLNEQKKAIIYHIVTHGIDPNVLLKPSGIDLLGDVPTHWEVTKLKHVAKVQTGITLGKNYGSVALES